MDWVTLLITILGALGGLGGIISMYHAKSNKDTIDISNFHSLLEEERRERELLKQDYNEYKESVNTRVNEVKKEVMALKELNEIMRSSISSAYRCTFPDDVESECPVLVQYQKRCETCRYQNKEEREDEI